MSQSQVEVQVISLDVFVTHLTGSLGHGINGSFAGADPQNELGGGQFRGSGGRKSPSGVQGRSPGSGSGGRSPP